MTVIIESLKFTCNRCGGDMTYEETKLGMKWTNVDKPENMHLCYDCGNYVIDVANGKESSVADAGDIFKAEAEQKKKAIDSDISKKYPTMKQLLKDSKKKHPFYGNQHKKVVRK